MIVDNEKLGERFEERLIVELQNHPENTLREIEKWIQKQREKILELQEELESNIENSTEIPASYLSHPNELYFKDETEYHQAATLINYSVMMHYGKDEFEQKLNQLEEITGLSFSSNKFGKTRSMQAITESAGLYKPDKRIIELTSIPKCFHDSIPLLIRPFVEQTLKLGEEGEDMKGLEETILHEGTHAYVDEHVSEADREVFDAVNEAAARVVSQVYAEESTSTATGYRNRFDISIMQTAESYFHDLPEESNKSEFISKVRGELVKIERKVKANPEKDILSLLNADGEKPELRKIKSFVYLLERVQFKVTDFLSAYGLIGVPDDQRKIIMEMNDYLENELIKSLDNVIFENRSILERELDSDLLSEKVQSKYQNDNKPDIELFGRSDGPNIVKQFSEARKELISLIEHLDEEISEMESKNLDKREGLTLKTLKNDREDLRHLVEEMGTMLKKVTADGDFQDYITQAERKAHQNLTNQEIKQIIKDSNRTSSHKLKETEQSLENTLLETANAWEAVLKRHQDINKSVISFCEKFHGEIEAEEEKIKDEDQKYELKVESQGVNQIIKQREKDFQVEISELENLAGITEKLFEFAKVSQSEVNEALGVMEEAKRKAKQN